MMLSGENLLRWAFIPACAILLLLAVTPQAGANSFANLDMFGFPATMGSASPGLSDIMAKNGVLSANSASYSPSSQFTGYFGSGLDGIQVGVNFAYPTATHDASTIDYASNVAYEASMGDDAISFPDISVDTGSLWSSFPTIKSTNGDVKYMESVQFRLSTESDTMPVAGFDFPGFRGSFL